MALSKKFITVFASVLSASVFFACSESNDSPTGAEGAVESSSDGVQSSSSNTLGVNVYATLEDLPNCTTSRENQLVVVATSNTPYTCTDGRWVVYGTSSSSSSSNVIASEAKQSSSSVVSSSSVTSSSSVESSSSVVSSSSEKSSSSVASSSSVKSSSSVASSSSAKSSSSVVSSSSSFSTPIEDLSSSSSIKVPEPAEGSSSSKANWAYLNPNIDYGTMTDTRDGQVYKTVKIGTQTWMAENLNYDPGDVSSMGRHAWSGCYGDGSYDYSSGKNLTDEEVAANCSKYGRLYTWEVAMDKANCAYGKKCNASLNPTTPVRGVCPQGWHLPSHYEFEELVNYIDPSFGYDHTTDASSSTAGQYLKSKSGWHRNGNGTDAYGFSALPGGLRGYSDYFYEDDIYAYFWSSGEYSSDNAFYLELSYDREYARLYRDFENYARSVRCLKD